jgi:hypothetical protein
VESCSHGMCKLHNLCIDFNDVVPPAPFHEDRREDDTDDVFMNVYSAENLGTWPENSHNSSERRNRITQYLKSQSFRRPTHANSRA